VVLSRLEEKYFKKIKFINEFQKETKEFRDLYKISFNSTKIENLIYYKSKSIMKSILTFFYMIFGVYENIFINIEYHSDIFYIPRHTKNYIMYYFLSYTHNIIFSIALYFESSNNLRILLFFVLTFPISMLIQILYRWVKIKEKVSV
jgi:hypothetical protein